MDSCLYLCDLCWKLRMLSILPLGLFLPLLTVFIPTTGSSFCFSWSTFCCMGLEIMVFLRACSWALCLTNDTLFLGKSQDTGRTMTSNTNRSINCKLHHQTRLQPSLHAHMPICYGSASLDVPRTPQTDHT